MPCRKKGETHRRCLLWGCRGPPGAAPSRALGRRARGGGRPASSSIGVQPQILHRGWGGTSRKKSPPYSDQIQVMGRGRIKAFSAESAEPTGLHPASKVRCRHKAAPPPPPHRPGPHPPPLPTPPRPMAGPGRGLGRPGVGRAGEAAAAAQAAGRLLPGRGERVRAWKTSATACPGRGLRRGRAGPGGAGAGGLPRNPRQI